MFIEERHKHILELLERDGKVLVKDLSLQFKVSESMIRKDLQALEKNHLLQRTYGGAINIKRSIANCESLFKRFEKDTDLKQVIAEKAYQLIQDNDTIFLDVSSISYLLIKLLIKNNREVTLITNMVETASLLHMDLKMKVIFIGGNYNTFVGGNIGFYSNEQIKLYSCNKSFIGCVGINLAANTISTAISEDAGTKKAIMSISKEVYLLASNERFSLDSIYNFANISDFHGIITESKPNDAILTLLNQYDIKLI
ncbi:DeoR/GlpR family DNA-binding transcription regulator [Anaeromicropila herbilytica]|uniref:DeoR family transcriptional regulator n=1 Tax=Anaeromicropila herbilytica TaxID=2785025 RepID=A0A7R7EN39_9FIRM|nr:DeoR/GlpR family DNA-binding transcription regulator [Anaeromicropila herbilytica]BCN31828.1 DeoR family transcriptional regulator [Anaeromicropila herbilytica]